MLPNNILCDFPGVLLQIGYYAVWHPSIILRIFITLLVLINFERVWCDVKHPFSNDRVVSRCLYPVADLHLVVAGQDLVVKVVDGGEDDRDAQALEFVAGVFPVLDHLAGGEAVVGGGPVFCRLLL